MSEELRVRRYRPEDADRVRELHEAAMREVGAYVEGVPEADLADVEASYLDAGGEFLVGETEGRIVAMGAFRPVEGYLTELVRDLDDRAAEVTRMRVDPAHQRRGYGTRIYDALERRARDGGVTEFVLDTTPPQLGARRLYEAQGFEAVRRTEVEAFDEPFELLVYRKPLADPP